MTTNCPFAAVESKAIADLAALKEERDNRVAMITATPFIIALGFGQYYVVENGRYRHGDRKDAVQYSREDADLVVQNLRAVGVEAEAITRPVALDRAIEAAEELLSVIRTF